MRRQQLANVLDMLPEQNQILTKYLISFLRRVSAYASDNLMTAANLATVRVTCAEFAVRSVMLIPNARRACADATPGVCAQSYPTSGR
jgi:hypothetical protein